jgi:hypothetical protein
VVKNESGKKIFHLNGEPYFINGEMDKGNWTDGGYLASTKEGWVHDINEAKKMGYNAIKKARRSNPKCSTIYPKFCNRPKKCNAIKKASPYTIYPKFCNRAEIALWADENPVLSGINPDKTALYWRFSSFCNRKFSLKPENFQLQNSGFCDLLGLM